MSRLPAFKGLLSFVLGFALIGAALAADAPDAKLKTTVDQFMALLKQHSAEYRADSNKLYKAVDDVVVPRFDVPFIAQLVLGLNWRNASADQRTRFADAFKNMLMRAYANGMLDNYDSVKVDWQPVRMAQNADNAQVNSVLTRNDGRTYTIGFKLRLINDDWKIYDIIIENISLVTNFRTQLNSEIKRTSLDDVIARMEKGEFQTAAPQVKNGQQQ